MNLFPSSPIDEKLPAGELLTQLLKELQCGPGQVILSETRSRSMGYKERGEDIPLIVLPKAKREVVEQFRLVAQRMCPLEEVFGKLDWLEVDIQKPSVIEECFTDPDLKRGWVTFRSRFPQSKGVVEVSCPAFASDFSQAMIEYAFMGGIGECCLYRRYGGQWSLVEKKQLWIT